MSKIGEYKARTVDCVVKPSGVDISVDGQHISGLSQNEVRELILKLLIFGGSRLRKEIASWIGIEEMAQADVKKTERSNGVDTNDVP